MAFYDYKCEKCQYEFTEMLTLKNYDKPVKNSCPSCGEVGSVKRLLSSSHVTMNSERFMGIKKPTSDFRNRLKQMQKGKSEVKYTNLTEV